jgi:hypothetical protein
MRRHASYCSQSNTADSSQPVSLSYLRRDPVLYRLVVLPILAAAPLAVRHT